MRASTMTRESEKADARCSSWSTFENITKKMQTPSMVRVINNTNHNINCIAAGVFIVDAHVFDDAIYSVSHIMLGAQ